MDIGMQKNNIWSSFYRTYISTTDAEFKTSKYRFQIQCSSCSFIFLLIIKYYLLAIKSLKKKNVLNEQNEIS